MARIRGMQAMAPARLVRSPIKHRACGLPFRGRVDNGNRSALQKEGVIA